MLLQQLVIELASCIVMLLGLSILENRLPTVIGKRRGSFGAVVDSTRTQISLEIGFTKSVGGQQANTRRVF